MANLEQVACRHDEAVHYAPSAHALSSSPMELRADIACPLPLDLDLSLGVLVRSVTDPCTRRDDKGNWWRALRTPDGPATLCIAPSARGVVVRAWGEGARWALERAPALVGARDSLDGFEPNGVVAKLHRELPGLRLVATGTLFQSSLLPVLEQKVAGLEAWRSYDRLLHALAEPAPGPFPLSLPPSPKALAALPHHALRRMGIDRQRGATLVTLARRATALERLVGDDPLEARRKLETLRGIGPWTSAHITRVVHGDPDAIAVGDFNLPSLVAFNLIGERDADDARMLELLAPYAGHRARVALLICAAGRPLPRRAPRRRLPRHAGF